MTTRMSWRQPSPRRRVSPGEFWPASRCIAFGTTIGMSTPMPITKVKQRLIMIPPDQHRDQTLISFRHGRARDFRPVDHRLADRSVRQPRVPHRSRARRARSRFRSAFLGPPRPARATTPDESLAAYLEFTALTAADQRIRAAAQAIAARVDQPRAAGRAGPRLGCGCDRLPAGSHWHADARPPWRCTWARACVRTSRTSCWRCCDRSTCQPLRLGPFAGRRRAARLG